MAENLPYRTSVVINEKVMMNKGIAAFIIKPLS